MVTKLQGYPGGYQPYPANPQGYDTSGSGSPISAYSQPPPAGYAGYGPPIPPQPKSIYGPNMWQEGDTQTDLFDDPDIRRAFIRKVS